MEECESVTCHETALLAVPCPGLGTKARSFSDTSIFKLVPQKPRGHSQTSVDDSGRISPPSPTQFIPVHRRDEPAPIEVATLKSKRKISRPRSPFTGEKAFDFLSKFANSDFVAKVTSGSPKLLARRTKSKSRDNDTQETVSTQTILKLFFQLHKVILTGFSHVLFLFLEQGFLWFSFKPVQPSKW